MDLTINQRLRKYLEEKKILHEYFRIEIGVNKAQQFSNWMTLKERIPDKYFIIIIKKCPDLNARWLLTGDGDMLMEGVDNGPYKQNEKPLVINDTYKTRCALCEAKDKIILAYEDNIRLQKEKLERYEGNGKARLG